MLMEEKDLGVWFITVPFLFIALLGYLWDKKNNAIRMLAWCGAVVCLFPILIMAGIAIVTSYFIRRDK